MKQITVEELRAKLRLSEGEVSFTYKKKDGEDRTARGTLREGLIPESQRPKEDNESDGRANGTNLKYWDLDKAAWRALSKDTETVEIL
jgi:hypothetical protein